MVLAEPCRSVAVVRQDPANRRVLGTDDRVVSRIAGRHFADIAEADGVMVAPGDDRRACRRAKCGGMKLRVAQSDLRQLVQGRRRNHSAEGAADTVAGIVSHDQQHVGCALGRHYSGGHHGFESWAFSLITPPNGNGGGGSCLPSMVVVALGEPGTPVICCAETDTVHSMAMATVGANPNQWNVLMASSPRSLPRPHSMTGN